MLLLEWQPIKNNNRKDEWSERSNQNFCVWFVHITYAETLFVYIHLQTLFLLTQEKSLFRISCCIFGVYYSKLKRHKKGFVAPIIWLVLLLHGTWFSLLFCRLVNSVAYCDTVNVCMNIKTWYTNQTLRVGFEICFFCEYDLLHVTRKGTQNNDFSFGR